MKFRKMVMELGMIAAAFSVSFIPSAVSVSAAETVSSTSDPVMVQTTTEDSQSKDNLQETNEETSEWENRILVVVDEDSYLHIRKEANTESEVEGILYRGYSAQILQKGENWTKIESGDIKGYVKNEYCVFDEEAEVLSSELCKTEATSNAEGVRIRSEASTDSRILDHLEEGETVVVDTAASGDEGWVPIQFHGDTAYVSAQYVDVALVVEEAVSVEEAKKAIPTTQTFHASNSDIDLLAALIFCEAGGEPYRGQLAVGAVVMNRVRSSSFPNTISGVIYQRGQFTPASSGKLSRVLSGGRATSSCYQAAREALSGSDNTGGAKFFHAGRSGSGTVIGNQIFY